MPLHSHKDRHGPVEAGGLSLQPVIPSELMQELWELTPVLKRRIVWAIIPRSRHLPASRSPAVAAVRALLVLDHTRSNTWAVVV